MIKLISSLFIFMAYSLSWSNEVSVKMDLLNELKILFKANQEVYQLEIAKKNIEILPHLRFIKSAYAQSDYQCLYGGWPSITKKVNGKTYCHDAKNSGAYRHSYACKSNEMTCPAVLFGKDVCIDYQTKAQKLNAYNSCEKNQKEINVDDYIPGSDHQLIMEYVKIAHDICSPTNTNPKIKKINCEKIELKLKPYEKKLKEYNAKEKLSLEKNSKEVKLIEKDPKEECVDCTHNEINVQIPFGDIEEAKNLSIQQIYEKLKRNFRNGPLCDPSNNFEKSEIKNHAFMGISGIMDHCSTFGKTYDQSLNACNQSIERISSILKIDTKTSAKWETYKNQFLSGDSDAKHRITLEAKKMLNQNHEKQLPEFAKLTYLQNNILILENDQITCPFPSFDAFQKAYQGMSNIKEKHNDHILTIVDYTLPSNQRRLFTFDLNSMNTLHNTWVAHGVGIKGETAQPDGSNPIFSNEKGSNLSSDGFILATSAAYGSDFGDNIILKGIDKNNSNMQSRAIVLHGDSKIEGAYRPLGINKEEANERFNIFLETDSDTENLYDLRRAANAPGYFYRPTIGVSWGCLGVPDAPSLDLKTNGYTSQLEQLRRDLAHNTIIFSYSGETMQSRYF